MQPIGKKFTNTFSMRIEEVEIYKETEHCVWVRAGIHNKLHKKKKDGCFFDTREECRDSIIQRYHSEFEQQKRRLDWARSKLEEAKRIKP